MSLSWYISAGDSKESGCITWVGCVLWNLFSTHYLVSCYSNTQPSPPTIVLTGEREREVEKEIEQDTEEERSGCEREGGVHRDRH